MPDICIFYSKPDKDKVRAMSSILKDLGWSVWWDRDIKSGRWGPEIERHIKSTRCVIPIWNSNAIRETSITFVEAEKSRQLNKPMITLVSEDIEPPLPFNAEHITANVSGWDYSAGADCVSKIVKSVESVLGIAPKKWKGERPSMINLLGKQVKFPCFVKSISSFETQLDHEAGLTVISLFPEMDALLVSAYDMHLKGDAKIKEKKQHELMCKQLESLDERGALILMDSGNYEKSRKKDNAWTKRKYDWVLKNVPYTYAFCYDNLKPPEDVVKNVTDVISRVNGKYENVLIPILHAPVKKGIRNHGLLPDIFLEYASRKESPFIAVPERELGEGICQRAETITNIRKELSTLKYYQPIHILGTGNPLSLLILAAAGADLFDGLEWCRTVADRETGFLFHHQQFDFFKLQSVESARYQRVREEMLKIDTSLIFKMGLHNLDFFYVWMEELQDAIRLGNVSNMITYHASFNTQGFVDELNKLMPGLFK